ncbi:MAG: nuclear transport factor 2 family protein [Deltaproteobacteria bacterium]|nr:nuclear transport factor 2 family protein [Deltaproteobacteria bacterium]
MTHTEHPKALLIQQSWQAVAHSDVDTLKALWDEDIVWHVTANNPWRGEHIGHEAVLEYLAQLGDSGESYNTTLHCVMANDEYAAAICHVSTKRDDRVLEVGQILLGRFEGRKIKEIWALSLDPQAVERFWA